MKINWQPIPGSADFKSCAYCGSATQHHFYVPIPEKACYRPMFFCNGECVEKLAALLDGIVSILPEKENSCS
jgi:hypothetical protein